ncbi:MAG TPA: hypothetical protein VGT44_23995 [Ktedonobacteraceae bacterium]|nr:hypothetical protein [Ktedonobacteraceae bacterium]
MSTRHTNIDKDQEGAPQTPGSLAREDTAQREKASVTESFPRPPQRPLRAKRDRWFVIAAVIVTAALILSVFALAISLQGQHPGTQVTPTPTTPGATATPTLGVSDAAYWDGILGTQGTNGKVESVSLGKVLGNPARQALVTVRHSDANRTLDVYVFDKITSAHPVQLFKLTGLVKGDAKISNVNTVITAEVDANSTLNAGKSSEQWTQDLFREFAWNQGEGTLVQVAFPGLFPDLTRYQAEADQASVDQGHQPWKNDPAQVAKALAVQFFQWNRSLTTTITSGGGVHDVNATVRVQEAPGPDPLAPLPSVTVQLSRLEGNLQHMWVAIGVEDSTLLTLTTVEPRSLVTSPVKLAGIGTTYGANEGIIGPAKVLDHLYTVIGQTTLIGAVGLGKTTYSTGVTYTSSFHAGVQEGIIAVYEANAGTDDEIASAVLVKVLLDP